MNKERLMTVLIQPHVSEKAAKRHREANQYVFRVRDDASKAEVKQAVELMFRSQSRRRQFDEQAGQDPPLQERGRQAQRLQEAYVRLETGQSIDFTGGSVR